MKNFSYPESLKLKSKKSISALFEQGHSLNKPPIRLLYQNAKDGEKSLKAGFTVSKKCFKKAVDRNLLKRRMREAFRLNRHLLSGLKNSGLNELNLMFIFISGERSGYREIESSMISLLNTLVQKLEKRI